MELAPIVVFVYNRPDHTEKMLSSLENCELSEKSQLIVYADGPKDCLFNELENDNISKTRQLIKGIEWARSVELIESNNNLGLSRSVISGVGEVLKRYGKAIIIEDDLILNSDFLRYMNFGLNKFENNDKIGSINGWMMDIPNLPSFFFLPGGDCWGWATWKDRWDLLERDGSVLLEKVLHSPTLYRQVDADWLNILRDQVEGRNDSWHIRWHISLLIAEKLGLYPGKSLISNIGQDGSGTHHTSISNKFPEHIATNERIQIEQVIDCLDVRIDSHVRLKLASKKKEPKYLKNKLLIFSNKVLNRKNFSLIHNSQSDELRNKGLQMDYYFDGLNKYLTFDPRKFRVETQSYLEEIRVDKFEYKFSKYTKKSNLYSTVFALLTKALINDKEFYDQENAKKTIEYLNSFQCEDGLFRDSRVENSFFEDSDWWGARHLALHIIILYAYLDAVPQKTFKFLEPLYNKGFIKTWLGGLDWNSPSDENDIDNKIMNYGALLQFSRDSFQNTNSNEAIEHLKKDLLQFRCERTGLWGKYDLKKADQLSRAIQFAYHIYPIYNYDQEKIDYPNFLIDEALKTQNNWGGYGVNINSSACEDIDSIETLTRLSLYTNYRNNDINNSLKKAIIWVFSNRNKDGGFVFRRNEAFQYGHSSLVASKNQSSIFPTWFRILSIAYTFDHLKVKNEFRLTRCPGLIF